VGQTHPNNRLGKTETVSTSRSNDFEICLHSPAVFSLSWRLSVSRTVAGQLQRSILKDQERSVKATTSAEANWRLSRANFLSYCALADAVTGLRSVGAARMITAMPNDETVDKLRRLEQAVAPVLERRIVDHAPVQSRPRRKSVFLRAALRTALAAAALAGAAVLWPRLQESPEGATAVPPRIQADEQERLRAALAKSERQRRELLTELNNVHQKARTGTSWYEDFEILNYRSPLQVR